MVNDSTIIFQCLLLYKRVNGFKEKSDDFFIIKFNFVISKS